MKYVFASDIHGSVYYTKALLEKFNESKAEKLILLGDLLYHGPRNDLPKDYAPKEVIAMLNPLKDKIYAVRGNCEAEVDQMVLDFPVMATYALLVLNGVTFYATHGHIYNPENLPPINPGEALIYGHVHLPIAEKRGDIYILNPGSTSNPSSYAVLEDKHFQILTFDGQVIKEIDFE